MIRRALLTIFAILVAASTAEAHLGHAVERAERYLKLELREREVRLVVTLTLGEVEGEALLRAADEDGDGRVSDEEATEHLGRWAAALEEEIVLRANGTRIPLHFGDGFFDPKGRARRAVATLEMVGRGRLPPGNATLELEDRMARRDAFERTDVSLVARPPVRILGDGFDEARRPPRLAYAFPPERAPEKLVLEVESPEATFWEEAPLLVLLGVPVALVAVLTLVAVRRRKNPRR